MNIPQIQDGLKRLFHQENQRIVFWYDTEGEFEETLSSLSLDEVNLIRLDQIGALEVKIRLEQTDPTGKYLLYAPRAEPALEEDWLLDIRLYSRCFYADRVSIWIEELGLQHQALRTYLHQRKTFLSNQNRLTQLKKWIHPQDQEKQLDLKMLVVLTKTEQPELFAVLMKLLCRLCDEEDVSLNKTSDVWESIVKFDLESSFWRMIRETFGYQEETPSLKNLLIRLFTSDFGYAVNTSKKNSAIVFSDTPHTDPLAPLKPLMLPTGIPTSNTVVFLSQWRENMNHFRHYETLSKLIAEEIQLASVLQNMGESQLLEVMTFELVEQRIISGFRDQLLRDSALPLESFRHPIEQRLDGHWANRLLADRIGSKQHRYYSIYKALEAAEALLNLQKKHKDGFSYPDADSLAKAYTQELFQFDQLYRLFYEEEDKALTHGGDILKTLKDRIEHCYSHWYMEHLSLAWGAFMEHPVSSALQHWKLSGVSNQQHFFKDWVAPKLANTSNAKVFVIISDAFRYEAAEELTSLLSRKNRFQAQLDFQLGVLPSYTGLGMVSLLPHKKITYKNNKTTDILIDDCATASFDQRAKILEPYEGTATRSTTLMDMKREEGRALVKDHRVIYIYHDTVDSTGDTASSEGKTFKAVREAINELYALVKHLINTLSANHVLVTADHGFLFQESSPEIQDKSDLHDKPEGTLKAKKRYLLGINLPDHPKVWHGKTSDTAGAEGNMEFWIPKGANRFHFTGGARFVHGGAMPQEVFVPIISIKQLRGTDAEKAKTHKVEVSVLGAKHKVTTNRHRLEFIQTEAVSATALPRTLMMGLWDGDTLSSNEETVTFSSESSSMDDRKKTIYLLLKSGSYDKKQDYFLIMRDAETKAEYQRVTFTINLAFTSDF
ncbi:BREX-1 system phosphatase PglZ type A [Deltaproteobacteria bacterium TL4]